MSPKAQTQGPIRVTISLKPQTQGSIIHSFMFQQTLQEVKVARKHKKDPTALTAPNNNHNPSMIYALILVVPTGTSPIGPCFYTTHLRT